MKNLKISFLVSARKTKLEFKFTRAKLEVQEQVLHINAENFYGLCSIFIEIHKVKN